LVSPWDNAFPYLGYPNPKKVVPFRVIVFNMRRELIISNVYEDIGWES
jgi:hypothetical protein